MLDDFASESPLFGLSLRRRPDNLDAEQALLGGLLAGQAVAYQNMRASCPALAAEHFAYAGHDRLFAAIVSRIEAGQLADAVTLHGVFVNSGLFAEAGGAANYLARLVAHHIGLLGIGDYARAIYQASQRRLLIELGEDQITRALGADEVPATVAASVAARLDAIARDGQPLDPRRPLHREIMPAAPFPVSSLGELRYAAEAIHVIVRAPEAMCAQAVLAAATLAAQPHYDIELPYGRRPLTSLFATVAGSGERKTAVDRYATRPVTAIERDWAAKYDEKLLDYRNDHDAWEAARTAAKHQSKDNRTELKAKLVKIGKEPKPPPHPLLMIADPSPEGIVLHLADRLWGGLFTAEGGTLVGGHAFTEDVIMRTGALLNTIWDGEPIRRVRAGTGVHFLSGRRCSAHVMMQPLVANRVLGDAVLDGIGTLARLLVVAPESTAGTRLWRAPTKPAQASLAQYDQRLSALLKRPLALADDGGLSPRELALGHDTTEGWIRFHDDVERELRQDGAYVVIRAFGAKMAEHAGRLAAVLAVYEDADASVVSADALDAGIALTRYYAQELMRLAGAAPPPELCLAQRLLSWWEARPDPRLYLSVIYQRGLNAIGDAGTARRQVSILEEHGWVRRLPRGTVLDGAPRRDAWELVPA